MPGIRRALDDIPAFGYELGLEVRELTGRVVVHLAASSGGWERHPDLDYADHAESLLDAFARLF